MDLMLEGRVALITGAASGIGRAVARRFVAEGARVVALDMAQAKLEALVREFQGELVGAHGDVTIFEDNQRAVERAVDAFGGLDVFVGNAGIFDGFHPLRTLDPAAMDIGFDQVFAVNVKGYLLGAKAALPQLARRRGAMVFTVSSAGFFSGGGGAIYTASKHAVVGLIRQLAWELAPDGVRVNGVAPGGTLDTDLQAPPSLRPDEGFREPRAREERIRRGSLLGIAARPDDHAGAYAFLASDQARLMTGTILHSDGGLGARNPHGQPPEQQPG